MLSVPRHESVTVDFGVFGGSGFSEFAESAESVSLETPYGAPSTDVAVAVVDGVRIGFLSRHGAGHTIPAHRVNYRANVWALAHLGAQSILAPFACGSLRADRKPGELVIVDQLIDRTYGRECTFFDGPETWHQGFADPYSSELGTIIAKTIETLGHTVHRGGTVVVVPGPRFSTRAEANWHRSIGADLVNMTQYPESVLASEVGLPYCGIGIVTDFDAGHEEDETIAAVHEDDVFALLARHAAIMRQIISASASRVAGVNAPS